MDRHIGSRAAEPTFRLVSICFPKKASLIAYTVIPAQAGISVTLAERFNWEIPACAGKTKVSRPAPGRRCQQSIYWYSEAGSHVASPGHSARKPSINTWMTMNGMTPL
jgi:hypothetical protein